MAEPPITTRPIIVWFRRDLRLGDNAALAAAVESERPVLAVYVLDAEAAGAWGAGAASRWWLHQSLSALGRSIAERGGALVLRGGKTATVLEKLARECGADTVHCSRAYEPWAVALESAVHDRLQKAGVTLRRFSGSLLAEPEALKTKSGGPFKVYTPFWRALGEAKDNARPLKAPDALTPPKKAPESDDLASWKLLPSKPDWAGGLREAWQPGEQGAQERLSSFVSERMARYGDMRNRPDRKGTSRLSPHLAFGEISPRQCWYAAEASRHRTQGDSGRETFLKEIAWREFSAHLLFHFPQLPEVPLRSEFAAFPWRKSVRHLAAWQRGQTGYPIVDAGMRELWATGWMHNRVRMIVASFLIKDLLIPWQEGERWFWDTLVDADLANNAASWQWVAGSGADAAPYFRIFNPVTQGETFDPEGYYVRRWVPELAGLAAKAIHAPWTASKDVLREAGVTLGKSYPEPIVDHAEARRAALAAFEEIKVKRAEQAEG